MWFVICFRSLTPKLTSRDRDYRKHVGTFFCSRIWIQWVDYSISSSLVSALPYPKLNKGKHGPRPVNFFFFFCCMPSTPCLIFFRDSYLFICFGNSKTNSECILHDSFTVWLLSPPPWQEEMSQVLDAMFEKFCTEGEHIIDQDDDGDNFYVIERWV